MTPAQQQHYLYAHQLQLLQHQQQQHQQQQQQQLNSGFNPAQQNPPFHSPYSLQQAQNGPPQVMGVPMGAAVPQHGAGPQRGVGLQGGVLHQQWAHLRPESLAWDSAVYPPRQGLIQASIAQQLPQQQQQLAYLQDRRSAPVVGNGMPPQLHGADGIHGNQPWVRPHDGNSQFGPGPLLQESRRPYDGMRSGEDSFRGNSHRPGGPYGRGHFHNKPYDNNKKPSGNRSRGGDGAGPANSHFKGERNEKGRGVESFRSQPVSLRCETCDRNFTNAQQFNAHSQTHVKCDVLGCSFEASEGMSVKIAKRGRMTQAGRVLKEHKQSTHDSTPSDIPVRKQLYKSKDSEEELRRWRDERKRMYPTTANIKRKAEEMKARKARGELVDEDARKRRERLKEILAKQAELGVPVAEVPAYYMSDRYGLLNGKGERGENSRSGRKGTQKNAKRGRDRGHGPDGMVRVEDKEPPAKVARMLGGLNASAKTTLDKSEQRVETIEQITSITKDVEADAISKDQKKVCKSYQRGRKCKKGDRCQFLHKRIPKQQKDVPVMPPPKRAPTLLAKLLESDIRREKSHLLQCFRFFVNNMFLLEVPEKPLKFFNWQEGSDRNSDAEVGRLDIEADEVEEEDWIDEDGGDTNSEAEAVRLDTGEGIEVRENDEDIQTSQGEQSNGEVTLSDGEFEEVQVEDFGDSGGEGQDPEEANGSDVDLETHQKEENNPDFAVKSD